MYSMVKKIINVVLFLGLVMVAVPSQSFSLNKAKRFWEQTKLVFNPNWRHFDDRMEVFLGLIPICFGSGLGLLALSPVNQYAALIAGAVLIPATGYRYLMHGELKSQYGQAEIELQQEERLKNLKP